MCTLCTNCKALLGHTSHHGELLAHHALNIVCWWSGTTPHHVTRWHCNLPHPHPPPPPPLYILLYMPCVDEMEWLWNFYTTPCHDAALHAPSYTLCAEENCKAMAWWWVCCFTSTETVGLLGTGPRNGRLDFHTAPRQWHMWHLLLYSKRSTLYTDVTHWMWAVMTHHVIMGHTLLYSTPDTLCYYDNTIT